MKDQDPPITIPHLSQFISILLGDSHSHPIPANIAEIVEVLAEGTCLCAIQWPDSNSPHLRTPLLWNYGAWLTSTEKWQKASNYSREQRVKRHIQEANIRLVARACKFELGQDDHFAQLTAFSLVTKNRLAAIRELGITKLIEREDEL